MEVSSMSKILQVQQYLDAQLISCQRNTPSGKARLHTNLNAATCWYIWA